MTNFEDDEEPGFLQRHRGGVFLCVAVAVGAGIFFVVKMAANSSHALPHREDMTMVRLPPPPPPPRHQPTPPKEQPTPEQQQEQKMVEQQPVQDEQKPVPKPPDAPPALGTSITGPGPDMGLSSVIGGSGRYGSGSGDRAGSKYGWYATQVQNRIAEAMRANPRTRKATMNVVIRIWPDSTGRVTRARVSSSGDPTLDKAMENDILTGLQLTEPPPSDMPLPIVMRVSARRQ